mmetsp:Transcript_18783/g.40764  ORF Transcript_18783/g.40764 Transcript_18783/m.40764 type:complete len:210 (+) Transcript_18783:2-631(+)
MQPVVGVHGGAGTVLSKDLTPEVLQQQRKALHDALRAAAEVLASGKPAIDGAQAAVAVLEDCPLFNAGRGSVLGADGSITMDASVMEGATGRAGAVAAVTGVKNPVFAAKQVMEHTSHVLLVGPDATEFARERGCAFEPPAYFETALRRRQLEAARESQVLDPSTKIICDRPSCWIMETVERPIRTAALSAASCATPWATSRRRRRRVA